MKPDGQPRVIQRSMLGLGTATFIRNYGLPAGRWQSPEPLVFRLAVDRGVRYFDTAASYGAGESTLGAIVGLLDARQVRVCTKVEVTPAASDLSTFVTRVEASLSRLRSARIDTVLAHNAGGDALSNPVLHAAWSEVKQRGLAARTGASTYGVPAACMALGLSECDVVQVEYSILNQEVIHAAVARKRSDQEIVVRSVLCKGLLTERRDAAPAEACAVVEAVDELAALATAWRFTLPELAIRFALDTPGVDVVLVGVGTTEELDTALRAAGRDALDGEQMRTLQRFDRSPLDCVHPERWGRVAVQ